MNPLIKPLVAFIPTSEFGRRVVGPPRATLTREQKTLASNDPLSFRYVAGRKAKCSNRDALSWLSTCEADGALRRVGPGVIIYRQERDGFAATGILADLSLTAYDAGLVKRHEATIPKTQRKMVEYMRTTRLYGNPPVTAIRAGTAVGAFISAHTAGRPDSVFTTIDGATHRLWVFEGADATSLCTLMTAELYITDGHHRLAAASLVAREESRDQARIPAGVFTGDQFRLRAFARCIAGPDLDQEDVVARLREMGALEEVRDPARGRPRERFEYGVRIGRRYFRFRLRPDLIPNDSYQALNTKLLQDLVLDPVFGITDPRTGSRLAFEADLDPAVEPCPAVEASFLPYPLDVEDVMAVADSARTMPPKSTWFAPKLPSGLVIRPIG